MSCVYFLCSIFKYFLNLQVIKRLTPLAEKVINEQAHVTLNQPLNSTTNSVASNYLALYDDSICPTDETTINTNKLPSDIIEEEMEAYRKEENPDIEIDVLQWWKKHESMLPMLSKLARSILGIPASSAATESNFSSAGFVVNDRRSQLNSSLVRSILVCRSNGDLL